MACAYWCECGYGMVCVEYKSRSRSRCSRSPLKSQLIPVCRLPSAAKSLVLYPVAQPLLITACRREPRAQGKPSALALHCIKQRPQLIAHRPGSDRHSDTTSSRATRRQDKDPKQSPVPRLLCCRAQPSQANVAAVTAHPLYIPWGTALSCGCRPGPGHLNQLTVHRARHHHSRPATLKLTVFPTAFQWPPITPVILPTTLKGRRPPMPGPRSLLLCRSAPISTLPAGRRSTRWRSLGTRK